MEEAGKVGDWGEQLEFIKKLTGWKIPHYLEVTLGAFLAIAFTLSLVCVCVVAAGKIIEVFKSTIYPLIYSPTKRERARSFRLFSSYLLREISNRNISESWRDDEFAELEAEVETEGAKRPGLLGKFRVGVRRERSLTVALRKSSDARILIEGDPGSGKSVALRHLCENILIVATNLKI